jgi:hypothetical protein
MSPRSESTAPVSVTVPPENEGFDCELRITTPVNVDAGDASIGVDGLTCRSAALAAPIAFDGLDLKQGLGGAWLELRLAGSRLRSTQF